MMNPEVIARRPAGGYTCDIDRDYIHETDTGNTVTGGSLNVRNGAIVDSHLSNFHHRGMDALAVNMWKGAGPSKIQNNYHFQPLTWKEGHATYAGQS